MSTHAKSLWYDESGFVVSAELILISTVCVLGLVAGLSCLRDAMVGELRDVSQAFSSVRQSYSYNGMHGCRTRCGTSSWVAGSSFRDIDCEDEARSEIGGGSDGRWQRQEDRREDRDEHHHRHDHGHHEHDRQHQHHHEQSQLQERTNQVPVNPMITGPSLCPPTQTMQPIPSTASALSPMSAPCGECGSNASVAVASCTGCDQAVPNPGCYTCSSTPVRIIGPACGSVAPMHCGTTVDWPVTPVKSCGPTYVAPSGCDGFGTYGAVRVLRPSGLVW
ncbi:MAG: hypothetical protein KDA58_09105 [Planctomycetaceae bacterium]|nr:hypothetical protein [Planctomycetaceae bacterium]